METIEDAKLVCCENGHHCCQKHHLERVRAIYQEGRAAFGGTDPDNKGQGQKCFMCRVSIPDALFSDTYFKNLGIIQAFEYTKMLTGLNMQDVKYRSIIVDILQKREDACKSLGIP